MRAHEAMDAHRCCADGVHVARDHASFKSRWDRARPGGFPIHNLDRRMRLCICAFAALWPSLSPAAGPSKNGIASDRRPQLPETQAMRAHEGMDAYPCCPGCLHVARDHASFRSRWDRASAGGFPTHNLDRPMRLWIRAFAAQWPSLSPATGPSKNAIASHRRPQPPET